MPDSVFAFELHVVGDERLCVRQPRGKNVLVISRTLELQRDRFDLERQKQRLRDQFAGHWIDCADDAARADALVLSRTLAIEDDLNASDLAKAMLDVSQAWTVVQELLAASAAVQTV